jgi:hypothetical protein
VAIQSVQNVAVEAFEVLGLEMTYVFPFSLFDGVTSATLDLALPRNALVDAVKLRIQARRVDSVLVQQVAQVRSYSQGSGDELVIDFGTPRTVSGVSLPGGARVAAVYSWLGSQFNTQSALPFSSVMSTSASFAEMRTERLRVLISEPLSTDELAQVRLHLPEPPSGLAIDIDGAPPAWTHPEPVQPRGDVINPDEAGWDRDSRRIVDLGAALAALTGDPLAADEPVNFRITLATAVPCQLALALEGTPQARRIRRMRFGSETAAVLDFEAEGAVDLVLPLAPPAGGAPRRIDELRWHAEADLGASRVMPPLGPDAVAGDGGLPLAVAVVTADRGACARLPAGTGLETLQALRLPLQALGDGAEARVVLWSGSADAVPGLPVQPLPQGTSDPVTLTPTPAEAWVTFPFAKPVTLPTGAAAAMPWMALVATRGSLNWALATAGGVAGAFVDQQALRRGPPNGPWKALPAPLQSPAGVLDARARLRLQGLAPKAAPLAPLTLALVGGPAAIDLEPTPKGVASALALGSGLSLAQPTLRLTSRVAGRLTLRDIDVVSDT